MTPKPGYAAGNILNMLVHLGADLTGYDFSGLSVWQAYVQGVALRGATFAHTDMRDVVFTKVFDIVLTVAFSPDGNILAAGTGNHDITLWRILDGAFQEMGVCEGHRGWVRAVAFSPDGRLLGSSSDDQRICLWHVSTGRCTKELIGHTRRVSSVMFHPAGHLLVSGSDDYTIRLWDIETGICHHVIHEHTGRVSSVVFSPRGDLIASASQDQTVCLWDIRGDTPQLLHRLRGHTAMVRSVAFQHTSALLASAGEDNTIRLWSLVTGESMATLAGHTNRVRTSPATKQKPAI